MYVCVQHSIIAVACVYVHLPIHTYIYYAQSDVKQRYLATPKRFQFVSVCACSCLKVVGVISLGRQIFHLFAFCAAARQTKINSLKIVLTILVFWHTPKRPLKRNVQRHKHMCLLASLCAYKYVNMYIYASVCSEMLSELCANTPQMRK